MVQVEIPLEYHLVRLDHPLLLGYNPNVCQEHNSHMNRLSAVDNHQFQMAMRRKKKEHIYFMGIV